MSILVPKDNKLEILDALEAVLRLTLFPNLKPNDVAGVKSHMDYIRQLPTLLTAKVRFGTQPETGTTVIQIELS